MSTLPGHDSLIRNKNDAEGGRAVKRLIIATALLTILAAPAMAQRKPYSVMSDDEKATYKASEEVDKQYRHTLDRTRKDGGEAPVDPWANMRNPTPSPDAVKKKN